MSFDNKPCYSQKQVNQSKYEQAKVEKGFCEVIDSPVEYLCGYLRQMNAL